MLNNLYADNINVIYRDGSLARFSSEKNWYVNHPISFRHSELYLITEGECIMTIDGKEYKGEKGTAFFIPEGTVYSYHSTKKPFCHIFIHFDFHPTENHIFRILGLPHSIKVEEDTKIYGLFFEYTELLKRESVAARIEIKAVILKIIAEYVNLSKGSVVSIESSDNKTVINKVLAFINSNLSKKLTNDELAMVANMHPTHFIRFFKKKTGVTPAKYVNEQKMEYAKNLLYKKKYTILEVAEMVGVESPQHFSKLFKKRYGISPSSYRKMPSVKHYE